MVKIGRNDPCWCGSGKKFKKCHWPDTGPDLGVTKGGQVYSPFGVGPILQTLKLGPPQKDLNKILAKIQSEKNTGTRPLPSTTLISVGTNPPIHQRIFIVDTCACLVDQNWAGRHEMCVYFAVLVRHALSKFGHKATVELGMASYIAEDGKSFELNHAWVRTELDDIIDGNADSLVENPFVPEYIEPKPYWGPEDAMPNRELNKIRVLLPKRDEIELERAVILRWKDELEKEINKYGNSSP